MKKKLIVRIFGGLGNQLFCYAAARRLAYINQAELVIDAESGFKYDLDYKQTFQLDKFNINSRKATYFEKLEPFSRYRRYLKRHYNKGKKFENRSYIIQDFIDFDQRLLNMKINGTVFIEGYWQSQNYFKDIEDIIRNDLNIPDPQDYNNQQISKKIEKINDRAVSLHIRFFDNFSCELSDNISINYYEDAINLISKKVSDPHFFIFSNNPKLAFTLLRIPNDRVTLIDHNNSMNNSYSDLWLMQKFNFFIIANSTFSWWGAWLSKNPNKFIVAPFFEKRYGTMWWGFDGLIPEEWCKLYI